MCFGLKGQLLTKTDKDHAIKKGYHNAMWLQSYTVVQGYFNEHSSHSATHIIIGT